MSGFRFPVRVYIEDTDAGGIVYYVNYLKYMERARSEWLRARGITQHDLFQSGVQLVVHRLECRYLSPARLDDALEVSADVLTAGRVRLQFEQKVIRNGEPLCEARVDIACIDASRHRPIPWPAPLTELLHSSTAQPQA